MTRRVVVKINAMSYAKLVAALIQCPATVQELADETGLHHLTVSIHVRALYKEGVVRIGGWDHDSMGRQQIKVWAWGKGEDAPKRAPQTNAQINRRTRARRKQREMVRLMAGQLKEAA